MTSLTNEDNGGDYRTMAESMTTLDSMRPDIGADTAASGAVISTLVRVTIICACFMIVELIGGYWANSVAVISDALHLSIDIIGYAIQITSAKLATKSRSP